MKTNTLILSALLLAYVGSLLGQGYQKGYESQVKQAVEGVNTVVAKGPFEPSWDSLKRYQVPEWYQDAKFGIFIHWGVYSVPAFGNEWYPRNMYLQGTPEFKHHVATYGPQIEVRLQGLHPAVQGREVRPRRLGRTVPQGRREVRRAGGRAPRRLRHVRLRPHATGARPRWGPSATSSANWPPPCASRGLHFGVSSASRRTLVLLSGRHAFDSDVQDPAYAGSTAPAHAAKENGAEPRQGAHPTHMAERLAGPRRRDRGQVSAASHLVRLVDRGARLPALSADVRRLLLQPRRRSGTKASPSTTRTRPFPKAAAVSTSSAASWTTSGRSSGRPIRRSA